MGSTQQTAGQKYPYGPPRVPEGRRVYAIGDIHGRDDLLARLHRMIADDARAAPAARPVVVYVGDYVDRGPDSFAVVERLVRKPLAGFETVHLKGNHEDFMLGFLADGSRGGLWLMNGGVETLESYGIEASPLIDDEAALAEVRRRLAGALDADHRAFLGGLGLYHVEGDYLFVHAGIRPGVPLSRQDGYDLMWIRHAFLDNEEAFEKMVVHGHSITPAPDVRDNRIGIDTGAYYSRRLTCLVLDGASRRFLQT